MKKGVENGERKEKRDGTAVQRKEEGKRRIKRLRTRIKLVKWGNEEGEERAGVGEGGFLQFE